MYLEIVSPEAILFSSDVDSVTVPGINGEFQMLKNHAPVVSVLGKGNVKIHVSAEINLDKISKLIKPLNNNNGVLSVTIKSGTVESKDDKVVILID